VIKDEVNEEQDDALATFVINSHMKNHPEVARDLNAASSIDQMSEEAQVKMVHAQEYLQNNLLDDAKIQ
jgi:DNA replicative helicase MCM subunit Mcm2 (Cdc46/Mcm family)